MGLFTRDTDVRPERREPATKPRPTRRFSLRAFRRHAPAAPIAPDVFRRYQPPPNVVGTPPAGMAMDSGSLEAVDQSLAWATAEPDRNSYFEDGLGFMSYPVLGDMAKRAEFRKPCEVIAREATREWIEFRSDQQGGDARENDKSADKIRKIEREFDRLDVRRVVHTQIMHALIYGLGHVWFGIKGKPLTTEAQCRPLVVSERGMAQGSLERLVNVEPVWTTPNSYNAQNPLAPDFYKPTEWWVMGAMVHASRLMTMVPHPVSQIFLPAYNFGGQSLTQLLRAYVHNYLATRNSVSKIVRNFSALVLKTDTTGNMQTDIAPGMPGQPLDYGDIDTASLQGRAAFFQDNGDGQGVFIVDKEREDVSIVSTPLSGLDSLQAQAMEAMASIPGIPLVKLFGIQPQGLNASSEGEIRVFYDEISAFQEAHVRPTIQRIFEAVQVHLWGKVDEALSFSFVPLWQMDEKQLAEIEKLKADTDAVNVTLGKISPEEAREREAVDERSIYRGIDLSGPPPEPPAPEEQGDLESLMKRGEEEE